MPDVLMSCGCRGDGQLADGSPVCAVHGCAEVAAAPDLTGRTATCAGGQLRYRHDRPGQEVPSSLSLAFFSHRPEREHDSYYCGCSGWD